MSGLVSQLAFGQRVAVYERHGDFAHVAGPDRYIGWTWSSRLAPEQFGGIPARVTSLYLDIRESPDSDSPLITRLPLGAEMHYDDATSNIVDTVILFPDGRAGYCDPRGVGDRNPLRAPWSDIGLDMVGTPYLWGGCTTFGIDCSGLSQLLYRLTGIQLRRDAHQQRSDKRFVPVEEEKPLANGQFIGGDLLFFGKRTPEEKVTHVGVALGGGWFLHAAGHGRGVIVTPCDDAEFGELFLDARRKLPNADPAVDGA